MKLIIGLGNPGQEYEKSRHNAGFAGVEALAAGASWQREKKLFAEVAKNGEILWAKPTTFMNNSGQAAAALLAYYTLKPADLWVIHDDLDLMLGRAQIRRGGDTAGHHGLESIVERLKTANFGRVRLGIRGQELRQFHAERGIDTNEFVMGQLTDAEMRVLARVIEVVTASFRPDINRIVNLTA